MSWFRFLEKGISHWSSNRLRVHYSLAFVGSFGRKSLIPLMIAKFNPWWNHYVDHLLAMWRWECPFAVCFRKTWIAVDLGVFDWLCS